MKDSIISRFISNELENEDYKKFESVFFNNIEDLDDIYYEGSSFVDKEIFTTENLHSVVFQLSDLVYEEEIKLAQEIISLVNMACLREDETVDIDNDDSDIDTSLKSSSLVFSDTFLADIFSEIDSELIPNDFNINYNENDDFSSEEELEYDDIFSIQESLLYDDEIELIEESFKQLFKERNIM
jgi:hypothetical protein